MKHPEKAGPKEANALAQLSAAEAARAIRRGDLSSVALVEACLDRIAEREADVGAWALVDPEYALSQARGRDASTPTGILHGVPIGIKDIMDTVDMPTAYGSRAYRDHRPAWDAACVSALRAAGAVILGKTTTSEFAAYGAGRTRNPLDLSRTTGISSMGSAAAVADHMVPVALGSQTGASVIRPAAFCGLVGYKPTFGRYSRAGIRPFADSLDTLGWLARDVADIRLLGRALRLDPDERPSSNQQGAIRIGFCRTPYWDHASGDVRISFEEAERRARAARFRTRELVLPDAFSRLDEAILIVMRYEGSRAYCFERLNRRDGLMPATLAFLESGAEVSGSEYLEAKQLLKHCRDASVPLFAEIDVIAAPAAECEPGPASDPAGNSTLNRMWTGLHLPCITLPLFSAPSGLPIGLQLIAGHGEDDRLLAAADSISDALGPKGRTQAR